MVYLGVLASPRNSFGSVPSTNSFSSEGNAETVAATCVPTEEESLFAKHSPIRVEQPAENVAVTEFGGSFSGDYKIQVEEQACPSNRSIIVVFWLVVG